MRCKSEGTSTFCVSIRYPPLVSEGLFFIPILLILPRILGLIGIQSAQAAADLFAFLLSVVLYRKVTAELNAEEEKQTE